MIRPRWMKEGPLGGQKLLLGERHVASVAPNHIEGWWYTAGDEKLSIPHISTLDVLPGFIDANAAKRAAFIYVSKHLKPNAEKHSENRQSFPC